MRNTARPAAPIAGPLYPVQGGRHVVVRLSRLFVVVTALIVAGGVVLLGGGLAAAGPNPPGDNGTVKLDRLPFDDHPDNQPHVGCVFQVDFYGFDEGALFADVTFESHPPTPTGPGPAVTLLTDTVFIGEDDNSGGGSEAGLDASETYTLDFTGIEPHPNQGFHVELTVHADGSQGADTKYKVFWVTGCGPGQTTTTTSGTTTTTTGETTTTSGTTTSTGPSSSVGGSTTSMPGSSVGGSNSSAGGGGGASGGGGLGLASTGSNAVVLLAAGLSILGIGVATLLGVRRRRSLAPR
jgi:LPXTG-motif cell wall-anchored protein